MKHISFLNIIPPQVSRPIRSIQTFAKDYNKEFPVKSNASLSNLTNNEILPTDS